MSRVVIGSGTHVVAAGCRHVLTTRTSTLRLPDPRAVPGTSIAIERAVTNNSTVSLASAFGTVCGADGRALRFLPRQQGGVTGFAMYFVATATGWVQQ